MKMKTAVMISDGRMKVIADELIAGGHEVILGDSYEGMKQIEEHAKELDLLLLPIRGIDENEMVHVPNVDYPVHTMMEHLNPNAIIMTGLWTSYLKEHAKNVYNYYDDETVREANCKLTAEGILYYFMQNTDRTMYDYQVDLIGCGHVGRNTAELFTKLGLNFRIVDSLIPEDARFSILPYEEWKSGQPGDVIINTAPVTTITKEIANSYKKPVTIIDIASNRVGVEPEVYEMEGIKVLAAPGLPGLVAERSAGLILFEYLKRTWGI